MPQQRKAQRERQRRKHLPFHFLERENGQQRGDDDEF